MRVRSAKTACAIKNGSHSGGGEELSNKCLPGGLDPKVTAEVFLMLAQRLSRVERRVPKKDGRRVPPLAPVQKLSDELAE